MTHKHDAAVNAMREANVAEALRNGPRLTTAYHNWIERRSLDGWVLVGGLGSMGCGSMWTREQPYHADSPTYHTCPIDETHEP